MFKLLLVIAAGYLLFKQPVSEAGQEGLVSSISFDLLAAAIQREEGGRPGDRNMRNNNPGNLRYVGQLGSTGPDEKGFAVFPDYQSGYAALIRQLKLDAARHPDWTLFDFISVYAPSSDNNDVNRYVSNIISFMNQSGGNTDQSTVLGDFA